MWKSYTSPYSIWSYAHAGHSAVYMMSHRLDLHTSCMYIPSIRSIFSGNQDRYTIFPPLCTTGSPWMTGNTFCSASVTLYESVCIPTWLHHKRLHNRQWMRLRNLLRKFCSCLVTNQSTYHRILQTLVVTDFAFIFLLASPALKASLRSAPPRAPRPFSVTPISTT